jgi:F-type H+-transporting ATPase subunit gamma
MSLLKLRNRFKAVRSLNSILSAMQVVTTVRMQRLKDRQAQTQKYLEEIEAYLNGQITPQTKLKKKLVLLTASRGLCGSFDFNLSLIAKKFIQKSPEAQVLTLTRQGLESIKVKGVKVVSLEGVGINLDRLDFAKAAKLFNMIDDGESEIYIGHNYYQGSANLKAELYQIYPVPQELTKQARPIDVIIEPERKMTLAALARNYIQVRFYQLLLNSYLAELVARLVVLKSAVDNSKDLIEALQLTINKMRQANITRELAEVVASAETMRSDINE